MATPRRHPYRRRGAFVAQLVTIAVCVAVIVAVVTTARGHRGTPMAGARPGVGRAAAPAQVTASPTPAGGSAAASSAASTSARHRLTACERTMELAHRMGTSFDIGPRRVDVLGDSYSVGTTLVEPRTQTWDVLLAQQLGWRLTVRGIGRTGFVNGGNCGGNDYQTRVGQVLADRPQLVVVQGGLNDVGYVDRVWQAAARLLSTIPSGIDVVVIGPPAAPAFQYSSEQRVDQTLRAAVGSTHGTYVSTLDWPLTFAPDGIHLDANGNRVFAQRLSAVIGSTA